MRLEAQASQSEGRLFSIDIPDSDQAVGGALGESIAGNVPRHGTGPTAGPTFRKRSQVLVRKRVEVEPLPAAAVGRQSLGKPVGEEFAHVKQAAVFTPRLLGQVHLRIIEILLCDFGLLSAISRWLSASFSAATPLIGSFRRSFVATIPPAGKVPPRAGRPARSAPFPGRPGVADWPRPPAVSPPAAA